MALFGFGRKAGIQDLREKLAAAHKMLGEERTKTAALKGEVDKLRANALDTLAADATELLDGLRVANASIHAVQGAVDALLEAKGCVFEVKDRCSKYTARLNVAVAHIAVATVAYDHWTQLLQNVRHRPNVPDTHSSAALAAIAEVYALVEAMEAEEHAQWLEAQRMKSIKQEFARFREMKEKLAELEQRDRARGPRNLKMAAAAVPHPDRRSHIIPKGVAGNGNAPPSMR